MSRHALTALTLIWHESTELVDKNTPIRVAGLELADFHDGHARQVIHDPSWQATPHHTRSVSQVISGPLAVSGTR